MPTLEDFVRARAMRASPQYAARIMKSEAEQAEDALSNPAVVAKAYSALQQFLQQKALADRASFEQQAIANFRAPQSLESMPQYQEPSPLQLWRNRLDAMMQSGNPVLQKQAMGEMQAQAQEEAKPAPAPVLSNAAKIAIDLGYKPGTKSFNDFVTAHAMKSGTVVNVGGKPEQPYSISDLQKIMFKDGTPVPPGTLPSQVAGQVVLRNNVSGESSGKLAMLNTAQTEFPLIDELLYTPDGKINRKLVAEIYALENLPVAGLVLSKEAGKLQAAFETGMQAITRTETGAAMAKEEIANVKRRFLPQPWDDEQVQRQKVKAFKFFINNATELLDPLKRENQGLSPAEIMDKTINKVLNTAGQANVPKKGDVVNGMEFIGTNPNNKDHWRKVK